LAALREREISGEGQWVDASLLDTMISWQTYLAGNYFATGEDPQPLGGAHPNIVPYQVFEAADGHFILAIGNDGLWESFVQSMNMDVLEEPRFKTNPNRVENREELIAVLHQAFIKQPVKFWMDRFESVKIPCGPVNKFSDILNDPHVKEREMVMEAEHPKAGPFKMLGMPLKLSRTLGRTPSTPPELGEHTGDILKEIGYGDEEITSFMKNGITSPKN
jgi:formyl-CoA transferase/CoA:oxalate CoA-transferase